MTKLSILLCALGVSAPIALVAPTSVWALPRQTSTLYCTCSCSAGTIVTTKTFVWSGTREGCQGYNGSLCSASKTQTGTLASCDTTVDISTPVSPIFHPPKSGGSINTR
jgi:hypothetical protein